MERPQGFSPARTRAHLKRENLPCKQNGDYKAQSPMPPKTKLPAIRTANVIDTPLSITNYRRLARLCLDPGRQSENGHLTICFADLNVLFLRKKDDAFMKATDATVDLFIPDGVSLRLLLAKKGIPLEGHITAGRFMRLCCMRSPKSVRHYILGGTPREVARLVDALRRHNPRLDIVGSHPGSFSPEDEEGIVAGIDLCKPHVLWNCLPTTRQEYFAERWKSKLGANVTLLVGAGFDFEQVLAQVERAGRRLSAPGVRRLFGIISRASRRAIQFPELFRTLREQTPVSATPSQNQWASGSGTLWSLRRRLAALAIRTRHRLRHWSRRTAKRSLDLLGGIAALILLGPLIMLTALTIFLVDGRPVFFAQRRVGRGGRIFRLWKFRTMRRDAELIESTAQAHKIEKDQHFFNDPDNETIIKFRRTLLQYSRSTKYPRDPRIIRFGRFIRRYSLDELPQFANVLSGTMSLVGPRPFAVYEVADYGPRHVLRHRVSPGITGPWQISDRNKLTFEESIELDLLYIENQSLAGDFKMLLKTVPAAFKNRGGE